MVQRGWIDLASSVFRVSMPGVNVRTATQSQLIVDERVIYPQILQVIFVPFVSGSPVSVVPIIDYGFVPRVWAYGRYSGEDNRSFPARASYSSGGSNQLQNHFFFAATRNQIVVEFPTPTFLRGAQLITMRPS